MAPEKTYQDINSVVRAFPKIQEEIVQHTAEARAIRRAGRDYTRTEQSLYLQKGKRATDYLVSHGSCSAYHSSD